MALIVGPPIGLQVEPRFTVLRDIFIHREKANLTYQWPVFVLSAIIIEIPYAFVTSLVYWLLWYYPVGYFYGSSRAGYSFLMYELFVIFATSLAQLCAAMMPNNSSTFTANGFFFMFCNTFAGTNVIDGSNGSVPDMNQFILNSLVNEPVSLQVEPVRTDS